MGILGFNSVEWFASSYGAIFAGYVVTVDVITNVIIVWTVMHTVDYQLVYTLLIVQKLVTTFWRTVKLIL